jgi:hypothetical protein
MHLEKLVRDYEDARLRGAKHEAQLLRVKHGILTGSFTAPPFGGEKPILVAEREAADPNAAVPAAFLASFNSHLSSDVLFPLRVGVTCVGFAPVGDFRKPKNPDERAIEMMQWWIVHRSSGTLVTSYRASNSSRLLPSGRSRLATNDARFEERAYANELLTGDIEGTSRIEPNGSTVYDLAELDVLIGTYSPFVFGLWPRTSRQASP